MIVQTKEVVASGSTGAIVQKSGPYKCTSHVDIIVFFKSGDKFSVCPAKNHNTSWATVRESDAAAAQK